MAEPPKTQAQQQAAKAGEAKGIKLTPKQQQNLVLAVLLIGVAGYGYWEYGYAPKKKEYTEKAALLAQKTKDYNEALALASKYEEFKAKEIVINKKVDFMNRRLPKVSEVSAILKDITLAATEANLRLYSFTPDTKEAKLGSYVESKIAVDFDTNYLNLGNFLTRLGYIERLIVPANIKIEAIDRARTNQPGDNIRVLMNIKVYSFTE
jgi:Tfp pilus assembly protein PilO